MIIFRPKIFSVYDDTDALKRMKDSDILSEEKRKSLSPVGVGTMAVTGGAALGATGALGNALLRKKGGYFNNMGARLKAGGKKGAIIGAAAGLGAGLIMRGNQNKKNEFYNNRLEYAQRQAARREKKDWKNNMVNREEYSY